jgi:hypothetical protein
MLSRPSSLPVALTLLLFALCACGPFALVSSGTTTSLVPHDLYDGYFVSNQFEPTAPASYLVVKDQSTFDRIFQPATVMFDKSHRLPPALFNRGVVIAVVHRGSLVHYRFEKVTAENGRLSVRYRTRSDKPGSAQFASPLIMSVPRGNYRAVEFIENGKSVKTMSVPLP